MGTRHRDGEGLVRTGLYEELAGFVPVTVREVESRSPVGVDGQGSLGSKNDVVVMATLADEKDLSSTQGVITERVQCIWRYR